MSIKKAIMEKKIDCPRCWIETRRNTVNVFGPNIEIDVCQKCNGMWLDSGELRKLIRDKKLSDYLTKQIGTQSKSELVCPRCGGLMDIETADDIEVDVCLTCHGVWLDSGEFEGLKVKSEKGFEYDSKEKAQEKWEEYERIRNESAIKKLRYIFKKT